MLKQEWVLLQGMRICAVTSNIDVNRENPIGVVFLHGFSQTKAGSYGLFSQICEVFDRTVPMLRFDYLGFGDSDGETCQVDFNSMVNCARCMTDWFINITHCKKVIFIAHGVGNYVATQLVEHNQNYEAILIMPHLKAMRKDERFRNIIEKIELSEDYLDTSAITPWDEAVDDFFAMLGGRMNRSKGIVVKQCFLMQIVDFDIEEHCKYIGNIKAFLGKNEVVNGSPIKVLNDYVLSDVLLLDMIEREKVVKAICDIEW